MMMKRVNKRIGAAIALATMLVMPAWASDLAINRETYEKSLDKITTTGRNERVALKQQYAESLEGALRRVKQTGDLDNTMAVMQEIERFKDAQSLPDELASLADIRDLQRAYMDQSARTETATAIDLLRLARGYDRALDRLQKRYVQEDQVDRARAVQEERKAVEASPLVIAARERVGGELESSSPAERGAQGARRWSFDGRSLKTFMMTGDGAFVETNGYVTAGSYGAGKDWHGPQGMRAVSLNGDFELRTALNFRTGTREQGRLTVGVILQSGTTYRMNMEDNHAAVQGHHFDFVSRRKGSMWSSGRLGTPGRLKNVPVMMQRRGNVLSFHIDGTRRGRAKGCDMAGISYVFFSIQRYSSYPPLREGSISQIELVPLRKGGS
jgi:hypothetical protein